MFERFTDRARRVVVLAQEEARMLNHNYIGTEHILLGLIHEGEGVAAKALESLGISLEAVRYFGMKQADAKVSALNLLPDLKPLFELVQAISSFGEKLSGMNSVVRGGAERDMSGKAVALWKSMAVQFMSRQPRNWNVLRRSPEGG